MHRPFNLFSITEALRRKIPGRNLNNKNKITVRSSRERSERINVVQQLVRSGEIDRTRVEFRFTTTQATMTIGGVKRP